MTSLPFFQVDAFAETPLTGNPAAVMPLDRWLDDATLQAIAAENNLSETAFTVAAESDEADYHLRWFTPTTEVDLCGHATLAAGHILATGQPLRFATRSGVLRAGRNGDRVEIDLPAFASEPGEAGEIEAALGVRGEMFLASGGNDTATLFLADEAAVRAVQPDFARLRSIPRMVIVTAPGDTQDIASRVFAASYGIDEDPVTGSAHSALAPLWADRLGRQQFTALQASKRGGLLDCRLEGDRVILGGKCRTVIVGQFQL